LRLLSGRLRRVVLVSVERPAAARVGEVDGSVAVVVARVRASGEDLAADVGDVLAAGEIDVHVTLAGVEQARLGVDRASRDQGAENRKCDGE
jgi:hypothetical protein